MAANRQEGREPETRDLHDAAARTRRGFIAAALAALASALLVGLLWLFSRHAPSAGRDPNMTPEAQVPPAGPEE
jgi:hypothetical protein